MDLALIEQEANAFLDVLKNIDMNEIEAAAIEEEQAECPVIHRFSPGLYIRELSVAGGTFLLGHTHKVEHLNIFLKGRVRVLNDDGEIIEMKAPMIFTGKPGRKMGYVIEDMVWLNVWPTDETDVEKLEDMFLEKTADSMEKVESIRNDVDRSGDIEDYRKMLVEYGISEKEAREESERTHDLIGFPHCGLPVMLASSPIEGRGLFATASIEKDHLICPMRIGTQRTPAGRFTNHSKNPNSYIVQGEGTDLLLYAKKDIMGCKGGFSGDEITIDYREALEMRLRQFGKRGDI